LKVWNWANWIESKKPRAGVGLFLARGGILFRPKKGGEMPRPTDVKALPNHRIGVRYDNGVEGEIELSDLAGRGVFEPLNHPAYFATVHLGTHGAIQWSSSLDLCPDAMYLRLTGKTAEELFPDIRLASADA
jgi:hypothetical protein